MKREDFKKITDDNFKACEIIIENNGACIRIGCGIGGCPFSFTNASNGECCGSNRYITPNVGMSASDNTLLESAKEFLKFREEKNMKDIFMYNGEIYEKVSEYEDLITIKKVNWYKYVYNALSICEQGESGFFIRKDHKGLYYCEPYTQDYNTTEAILCCNDGYRIEAILAILNNVCPDFYDVAKLIKDL